MVAVSENGVIGRAGVLPWRLPDDMKRFRRITLGHHVLMGRLTFESIGRPLAGRVNVVLSRTPRELPQDVRGARDLEDGLAIARRAGETEVFVIGGTSVYAEALPRAHAIHLTRVHAEVEGDARFPEIDAAEWREASREPHPADERHAHAFTYLRLERRAEPPRAD